MAKHPLRRKKRARRGVQPGDSDTARRSLRLTLESLELVRGHDGLLRGKPEPALLLALYRTNGPPSVSLVSRLLVRAKLNGALPCNIDLGERELRYDARFADKERIVVLAFAVEEDSGEGVKELYAAFETPEQFLLYSMLEPVPVPRGLDEWARLICTAPSALPVEVLLGAASAGKLAGSDEYVSAAAFASSVAARENEVWRLPFADRDGKNEWVLVLRLRVT